jgi:S-adenosylmethionine decarboxylase
MVFEGSEKKFECTTKNSQLRNFDQSFFEALVVKANASILKKLSTATCDAYLLSESSLFVWDNRILMITCGNTTLKDSLLFLVNKIGEAEIASLIYQRKNEHFSSLQQTDFEQDVEEINNYLKGTILKLGQDNGHHNLIYSLQKPVHEIENDTTFEIFCYDIVKDASEFLTKENLLNSDIRSFLKLENILKGFEISDFVFEPCGYSMNAIRNQEYCTIHVTPQKEFSYVSFESNMNVAKNIIVNHLVRILSPGSIDIVSFNLKDKENAIKGYDQEKRDEKKLKCGYHVDFLHLNKRVI